MKPPSTALLRTFLPLWQSQSLPRAAGCLGQQQKAHFSSTQPQQARKKGGGKKTDTRITMIRYHLFHPLTPRPLRFSRHRALRHWTIHRAFQLHTSKLRQQQQLNLERQYNSMARACEALRLIDHCGLTEEERAKMGEPLGEGEEKKVGRLYRLAMRKTGVWEGVPVEYARLQTETPSKSGWNHGWTR